MWQKERLFSLLPFMKGIASWFWIVEPVFLALMFFACAAAIRQKTISYLCIIAASFLFAFGVAEMYFSALKTGISWFDVKREYLSRDSVHVQSGRAAHLHEKDGISPDPVLGFGPNPNAQKLASRLVVGGKVIYDVLYSLDKKGRRVTPDRGDTADTAILLFGCSFTFGEGLNDRETYAWQLGEMLGERFQVFNYGFSAYGAHQMLALVESGRLDALARRYKRIYASFLTIADHAVRCVGPRPFQPGPRYILENGTIKYAGKFSDTLDKVFAHSRTYERVKSAYYRRLTSDLAVNTHTAIIVKSMQELATRYHAHFVTVLWPDSAHIEAMLRKNGVSTLLLTDITDEKYKIESDGHPNALANTRIAEALSEYILKQAQTRGAQP
jgi:hypothetical protein